MKLIIEEVKRLHDDEHVSDDLLTTIELLRDVCQNGNKMTKRTLHACVVDICNRLGGKEETKAPKWVRKVPSFLIKEKHCAYCGDRDPRKIKMICTGCEKARYCNENCHKKHWKIHKKHCNKKSDI